MIQKISSSGFTATELGIPQFLALGQSQVFWGMLSAPSLLCYTKLPTPGYPSILTAIYRTTAPEVNQSHRSTYKPPGLHSVVLVKVAKARDHLANCKDCFGGPYADYLTQGPGSSRSSEEERYASFPLNSLLVSSLSCSF